MMWQAVENDLRERVKELQQQVRRLRTEDNLLLCNLGVQVYVYVIMCIEVIYDYYFQDDMDIIMNMK